MSTDKVDKKSPLPLYHQIKEAIKEKIENKTLKPHQQIPSERKLEQKYGTSRMTARKALEELESEGYVYREQGKGSFVAEPKLRQSLLKVTGFSEDMRNRKLEPGAKVLQKKIISGETELSKKLHSSEEEKIFKLKRIRLAGGEPLAIETTHLRYKFCPGIEEKNFSDSSLYETLRKEYSINLIRAEQSVEATTADDFVSRTLKVEEGSPMLMTERTTYREEGETPVEFARSIYRGDRYKLYVELRG